MLKLKSEEFILTEAAWNNGIHWKFIVSKELPDPNLCTATFCVATHKGKLLLIKNKERNWELPGGHVDEKEEVKQALVREVLEETGALIENPQMFGYKLVIPTSPIPHRDRAGHFYPFPYSYILYFYAEVSEFLTSQTSDDVTETTLVNFRNAKKMLAAGHNHDKIIDYLIQSKLINLNE